MNKKGEVSLVLIFILVAVGLLIAHQTGLFEIFTPNVGQPSGTDSLVNKVYYPATSSGASSCEKGTKISFRTTSISYSSGAIAYASACGISLTAYGFESATSAGGKCSTDPDFGAMIMQGLPVSGSFNTHSGGSTGNLILYQDASDPNEIWICEEDLDGNGLIKQRFDSTDSDSSRVSISPDAVDPPNEISCVGAPIKDSGIYAISNGDIVTRYCSDFGDELFYDCPSSQPAEFLPNFQTDSGIQNVVKCSGNYIPNQKLCIGNNLYSTNSEGSSINSEVCGYQCVNKACIECQDGEKRCSQNSGTTTDIEICQGGRWAQWNDQRATCIGEQQCVAGECTSDTVPGIKRCNGKQPQIFTPSYVWQNDGESCDVQCNEVSSTEVSCTKECDTVGYHCAAGELYDCQATDRDNDDVRVGSCASGYCTSDNSKCSPTKNIGDKYCSGKDIFKAVSSGNPYDLSGGVKGELQSTCANSCVPVSSNDAKCSKISGCDGKEGLSICLNQFERATCSNDGQSYSSQEDCSTIFSNGFCELQSSVGVCSKPESQCSGNLLCTSGIIRACTSGSIGDEIFGCNDLGCQTLSSGLPVCVDQCTTLDQYSCRDGDSYLCSYDDTTPSSISQKQKVWELANDCGNIGCDSSTGKCTVQCTGSRVCSAGQIRSCSNGIIGNVIDDCNNKGCNEATDVCLDECNTLGTFQCKDQNSYQCVQKSNNQKVLELATQCSSEGCDSSTGKCISSGTPNTYTCIGEDRNNDGRGDDLWFINQNGFLDNLVNQCGAGVDSYCSLGISYCKFCEQNYISCSADGKQEIRCQNDQVGEIQVLDNCEVGCFVQNSVRYCDDLKVIISQSQNFLADESISIKGIVKGSESDKGVVVPSISVKLEGAGESITKTGASGTSGNFDINFGKKDVGNYVATVSFPDYNKQYTVNVKVTNDFIIKLYGSQVLTAIPGTTASTELEVVGGTGEPDDIVDVELPDGLTAIEVTKTDVAGRWKLQANGEPGIYQLKLAAVENGVTLDPYTISIEIREPSLGITTNVPDSDKIGEQEYEIKVLAPQIISGNVKTDSFEPDSITLTIDGNIYDLSSGYLGSGRYLFTNDFTEGTHTINIDVSSEGYKPASISKQLQISSSGNELPPSSTEGAGGGSTESETETSGGENKFDTKTIVIILIIIGGGYLILNKK